MHIGFLSFRIAGTDGVSLEAERWALILQRMGHQVTMLAGELDRKGILIPALHFQEPLMQLVEKKAVQQGVSFKKLRSKVFKLAERIEDDLLEIFAKFKFDHLIVANSFSLPVNFSLGVALDRVIKKLEIKTTSRNHDFWWERDRFSKMTPDWHLFLQEHFPPLQNHLLNHLTINSLAQKELKRRTGLDSMVIGDSFDFNNSFRKHPANGEYWRRDFKIKEEDVVFLQATRVIPRKQIELAIELVHRLKDPRIVLVIAGYSGDEGGDYLSYLRGLVDKTGIRARFIGDWVGVRNSFRNNQRIYTLWDCFENCDLTTYPSRVEGFGNQFIEALYFKKPVFLNRYPVYQSDLEPLGFKTIAISGRLTRGAVEQVRRILASEKLQKKMVETNFRIARRHFSFEAVQQKLAKLGF